jgi:CheY-like chemotaxis protein
MLLTSSTADLIDSIGNVLGAVAWPLAIFAVAWLFRDRIRAFIAVLAKRAESDDVEVALGRVFQMAVKSTASFAAATEQRREQGASAEELAGDLQISTPALADIAIRTASRSRPTPRILWVDGAPQNNVYERQTFEALGIDVVPITSTDQAVRLLEAQTFDVIISNMRRGDDDQAAYTLLEKLPDRNRSTPFIVYSSSNKPEHKQMARERGALGATNSPTELLALVQKALAFGDSP